MPVEADGTGVDWNNSEDMSVFARANMINELNAQIPRIGPSAPQMGDRPDDRSTGTDLGGWRVAVVG